MRHPPLDAFGGIAHVNAMIYKIFRKDEWAAFERTARTSGAPIDLADGYIHFSTAKQAAETAAKHFAGVSDLWLAAVDDATLGGDLKWEVSRGNALFPHLYRDLALDDVVWCKPLPLGVTGHEFPDDLT